MSGPITFQVIDLNCQAADRTFFTPQIVLQTTSKSTFATVLGYDEFGTPSTPPKKYRTITLTGFSKRVAFTGERTPRQCAGAEYIYSGSGQIDFNGNQISKYSKKFYAQCSKQFWPQEPLQKNDFAITTGGFFPEFVGFCFPTVVNSCPTCDSNEANWSFIGDLAVNVPQTDLSGFLHNVNDPVVTKTSYSINDVFYGLTSVGGIDVPYTSQVSGNPSDGYTVNVGPLALNARLVGTNPTPLQYPATAIQDSTGAFVVDQYVNFTDTNNYSAVLSNEYTDADAAAHATTYTGKGATAQNLPRTTGFTSVTTTVDYSLVCSNLVVGQDYLVTVDLWSQPDNTHTPKQYGFTADATTHTINDSIAQPAAQHTTTVRQPTIVFSP